MDATTLPPDTPDALAERVLSPLQDALVEVEVWRQNARTPEEWTALRRLATALSLARQELQDGARASFDSRDDAQQSLLPA